MMDNFLVFGVFLLVVVWIEAGSMGSDCGFNCVPKHPQQKYCDADFVIRGQVKNRNYTTKDGMPNMETGMGGDMPFNYYIVYTVAIEKVFKGPSYYEEGMEMYIKTEASNSMCGIGNLMNRKSYLLSGQKEEDTMMNINGCNWVTEFKKLTSAQKTGVKRQYGANCNSCEIEDCENRQCKASAKTRCVYNPAGSKSCHQQFSYCILKKNGVCKWDRKRDEMKECLRENTK
ncbi:metalloproteinase inhibitor 3-like [Antedon mediterranea]|uniref:metalloproteinase inhibitor 3-like n=1 Tax=Antedon mediterranea TaxID=105859 RepID=UPI003AF9AFE6